MTETAERKGKVSKTVNPKVPDNEMSRVHRFMLGDRVALNHDGIDNDDLNTNEEGTVTAFGNDEQTYLRVEFDNGTNITVTEDELRHLPPA